MLVNTQGVGSFSRRSSGENHPMPNLGRHAGSGGATGGRAAGRLRQHGGCSRRCSHPSPLRLPCARWKGRLGSPLRSRASYDCERAETPGPGQRRGVSASSGQRGRPSGQQQQLQGMLAAVVRFPNVHVLLPSHVAVFTCLMMDLFGHKTTSASSIGCAPMKPMSLHIVVLRSRAAANRRREPRVPCEESRSLRTRAPAAHKPLERAALLVCARPPAAARVAASFLLRAVQKSLPRRFRSQIFCFACVCFALKRVLCP